MSMIIDFEIEKWLKEIYKKDLQKSQLSWLKFLLNIKYWKKIYFLRNMYIDEKRSNEWLDFFYNWTYEIFLIKYWKYLLFYFNDIRNIQKTRDLYKNEDLLSLMNKQDHWFLIRYKKLFNKQLKTFFENEKFMKKIYFRISQFLCCVRSSNWNFFYKKSNFFNQQLLLELLNFWKKEYDEHWKLKDDWVLYLDNNWVTIKSKNFSILKWSEYYFNWIKYYIAKDLIDLKHYIFKLNYDCQRIVTTFVKNFNSLFYDQVNFDIDISHFDTSNVVNMRYMFNCCSKFNQNVFEYFDTSKVEDMWYMLQNCKRFNQQLTNLNTSKVNDLSYFLSDCENFNQQINHLDTYNCDNFECFLFNCHQFNQEIDKLNFDKAEKIYDILTNSSKFKWNVKWIHFKKIDDEKVKQNFRKISLYRKSKTNEDLPSWRK